MLLLYINLTILPFSSVTIFEDNLSFRSSLRDLNRGPEHYEWEKGIKRKPKKNVKK